jgi:uncharacterized coiled-coil protein SlyX
MSDERLHDIEPREPSDHLTIERRLARLENDVCRDGDGRPLMSLLVEQMARISKLEAAVWVHGIQIEVLNVYLTDTINTDSGMDQDILDLAERVSALEDAAKEDQP